LITKLTGTIQPYGWGSRTVIADLLGVPPTGEPQAELWFGAHPLAPSVAVGRLLTELIAEDPDGIIGVAPVAAFGPRLPFLVKIIAADQPLSLQAHPSRAQAEAGYAREQAAGIPRDAPNRTYRDGWPKPEVLCALAPTEALYGFRRPDETYALFEQLGAPAAVDLVAELADRSVRPQDRLCQVFGRLLRLSESERSVVRKVAAAAVAICSSETRRSDGSERQGDQGHSSALRDFAATATELSGFYPNDPGVLAALLMNRVSLQRHNAIFLPPGNLHAYLRGCGVEIMANSDNVMRGGLTPKFVNVDELLKVLDFTPGFPGLIDPALEAPGVWRYPTPTPEFSFWRLEVGTDPIELPGEGTGRIVLVTDGSVTLASGTASGDELTLRRGESALVTATEQVRLSGAADVFVGAPGVLES
jgi:mannose-6-phosphate isomerase